MSAIIKSICVILKRERFILICLKFFSGKTREDFSAMAKEDEYMEEAVNMLFKLSADEQKRLEYEAREKAIRDHNWLIQSAEQRGVEKGRTQGKNEGLYLALEILRLHANGKTVQEIAEECEVALEQVKSVLQYDT